MNSLTETIDAVAEAMYRSRPRRIAWEDLTEIGWKAEYRRMAKAAIGAYRERIWRDPVRP